MKGAQRIEAGQAARDRLAKGSPFADGALFAKAADLGTFSGCRENSELLRKLNKRLKLFRGEDGWFATGRLGQVWEYGTGKLGSTVGTGVMISKAIEAGFTPTQRGDGEANFSCDWTDESVERLIRLLKLRIRRGPPANAFKSERGPEHRNGKISGESERIGVPTPDRAS
jgi:hypothetical protein